MSQSSQCVGKKQSEELKLRMRRQATKRRGREAARSELRACVCLCVRQSGGIHYHVLAFCNGLRMTRHFDLPARHPGVKHNEGFVRGGVCTRFVYVCPALTELELFQGLKV